MACSVRPEVAPSANLREPGSRELLELADPQAVVRRARFRLRDTLLYTSSHPRQRACGRFPSDPAGVTLSRFPLPAPERELEATARFHGIELPAFAAKLAGVRLCDLIWTCPVCSPRLRQERGQDLERGVRQWVTDLGMGTVFFLTLTVPHDYGEPLREVLEDVRAAWSRVIGGRGRQRVKHAYGIRHYVRSHDVTVGRAGWHPHLHAVLFGHRVLTDAELIRLRGELLAQWQAAIVARGRRKPSDAHGIRLEVVRSYEDIAAYVVQLTAAGDEKKRRIAFEIARGDLKSSRHAGQRTPFQVLADYTATRSTADLKLWREWETETRGIHAIQWSRGLRECCGLEPAGTARPPDPDPAGLEHVYSWPGTSWLRVSRRVGRMSTVMDAGAARGEMGVYRLLKAYERTDSPGGIRAEIKPHLLPIMRLERELLEASDLVAPKWRRPRGLVGALRIRGAQDPPAPGRYEIRAPSLGRHVERWRHLLGTIEGRAPGVPTYLRPPAKPDPRAEREWRSWLDVLFSPGTGEPVASRRARHGTQRPAELQAKRFRVTAGKDRHPAPSSSARDRRRSLCRSSTAVPREVSSGVFVCRGSRVLWTTSTSDWASCASWPLAFSSECESASGS